ELYIIVEKILGLDEKLPSWPIWGTTGYDFLNHVNAAFIHPQGYQHLLKGYQAFTGKNASWEKVCFQSKKKVMQTLFYSEMQYLAQSLTHIAKVCFHINTLREEMLLKIISEITAHLSIYRTYRHHHRLSQSDRYYLSEALRRTKQTCKKTEK